MQIIIPMSGFGERFRRAGYSVPKPLIEINGKPIIAHVIEMFPGETDFIFICNEDHLNEPRYEMRKLLQQYCPTGRIVPIRPHHHGPIYAVLQAISFIDVHKPTIVNYCDFTCYWDWIHFKKWVENSKCQGAVPAYRGFHPHTLGTTHYAYIREKNGWMSDIQEKKPFTDDRMNEFASSGTYYFSSGQLMLDTFQETVQQNLQVSGEYYVSLAYKILLANQLPVAVYDLQHFMQWGTPQDVAEYNQWSHIFEHYHHSQSKSKVDTVIIPMAGLGQRFLNEAYPLTKPLIPVSGKPMVMQAVNDLPSAEQYVFVMRKDMPGLHEINAILLEQFPHAIIKIIPGVTEGQACTALIGLDALTHDYQSETILLGACDNGAIYHHDKLEILLNDPATDVIVFGARGHTHAIRHPTMYGWIDCDENNTIHSISVKKPLGSPATDLIVPGTFIFKRAHDFRRSVARMIARNARVNHEFYLDTCINDAIALGLSCKVFEIDYYISWGTPNDLRTFEYWQSCFHKWPGHSYDLKNDLHICPEGQQKLLQHYQKTLPSSLKLKVPT